MMRRKSSKNIALAMSAALLATAASARADVTVLGSNATVSGEVTAGVQQKIVDGSSEKFEEYRDVVDGVLLHDFRFKADGNTTPYYLDLKVKNPLQDNEYYGLKGGIHGKFGIGLFYDSIPHNFNSGNLILSGAGTGRLNIADQIQSDLQNEELTRADRGGNPNTDVDLASDTDLVGQDAEQQAIIRDLQANTNPTTFKLKRQKTGFSLDYNVTPDIKTWAKVTNEKRNGTRVITTGTYERFPQGASGITHTEDLFLVSGMELAEPIDYRTTVLNVGAGVYKKNWLADVEYTFTNFDNKIESLVWDNPFRITDATATNSTGGAGNEFGRGRFAKGQLDLAPSSQSHDFTVSGSVDLPLHSKFAGTVSYGWVSQDDPFVPYTLNSAISGVAGFDVTNPANLPQSSLNGWVNTLTQSYVLTSKPIEPLALTAKYRYYDYDNQSDSIRFPGYAGFGESYWRTFKNDVAGTALDGKVVNEPLSFTRQNAELAVDYHVAKPLTVSVEGFWEDWARENLRIDGTTELGVGGGFIYKPTKKATLKGSYKYAHRTVEGYTPGNTPADAEGKESNPEAKGLANYDWAERKRHKADLRLTVIPTEAITVGVIGQYMNDEYGEDNRFGLKKQENALGGLDIAYSPSERVSFYANYTKEYRKGAMQSGAKDDTFNDADTTIDDAYASDNFNPLNYWNTNIYEKVDTVGIGTTLQIIPQKLTLNTGYTFSYSKMDFVNYNPNAAAAVAAGDASGVKLANALAQSWPTVTNRFQEVRADIGYNFTKNLKMGVNYLYEWYKLDDFANTPAYMAGASAENSTKFVFTGANQFSYEAHVAGAYLNYTF